MNYFSPFHLIDLNDLPPLSRINPAILKSARKRWLVEFDLQNTTTISVVNKDLDKDTILKHFDSFSTFTAETWKMHQVIYENKGLLKFLEQGDISFFSNKKNLTSFKENQDLLPFIATSCEQPLSDILHRNYREKEVVLLEDTLETIDLFPIESESQFYRKTYRFIKGQVKELEALIEKGETEYIEEHYILPFVENRSIESLNSLPSYFDSVRDEYGLALEDMSLILHNAYRRTTFASHILKRGLSLKLGEDTSYRLNHVLQQIEPYAKAFKDKHLAIDHSEISKIWSIIHLFILGALVILLGLKTML